jgi:hypothetical protein
LARSARSCARISVIARSLLDDRGAVCPRVRPFHPDQGSQHPASR